MKHPWLFLLTVATIGVITLAFYSVSIQPIETSIPEKNNLPKIDQPTVTYVNPKKGADDPAVTIIEFGDFRCRHCGGVANALDSILSKYPEKVQVVWKNMPNESAHPLATKSSIAAHCAGDQKAFWAYHDKLFENQALLNEDMFTTIAQNINLDTEQFESCLQSNDTLPIVRRDLNEALALDLTATPTLFINGERHTGAINTQELLSLVQQALSKTETK